MTTGQSETACRVLIDDDAGTSVIRVDGELDSLSAGALREGVARVVGREATILDIRQVPFVDSAGLGALVGGIRRLREAGGSVALCCTRSSVLRLLRVTGLDRVVAVTESPLEARRAIADDLLPA
jgi:anti-sigma B factor antagonist